MSFDLHFPLTDAGRLIPVHLSHHHGAILRSYSGNSFEFAPSAAAVLVRKALQFTYPASGCYDLSSTPRSPGYDLETLAEALVSGADNGVVRGTYVGGNWRKSVVRYRSRQ